MLNIFSLYKKQHEKQKIRISIYEKVLLKCHRRIKYVADYRKQETFFIVPEYLFGIPLYNQIACVCYLIIKLRKNGFKVKYTHPNFIYISWKHYNNEAQYNYELNIPQIEYNSPYTNTIKYKDEDFDIEKLPTTILKKNNINHYKNLNDKLISDIDNNFEFEKLNEFNKQDKLESTGSVDLSENIPSNIPSNIVFKTNNKNSYITQNNTELAKHMNVLEQLNHTAKFISN